MKIISQQTGFLNALPFEKIENLKEIYFVEQKKYFCK